MRLLLDEMISPKVAQRLRERGWDVESVAERADLVQLPDEQLLTVAAEEQRVLVTFDIADFALLAGKWGGQGRSHPGVVYLSARTFPQDRALLGALLTALDVAARNGGLPGPDQTAFLLRGD